MKRSFITGLALENEPEDQTKTETPAEVTATLVEIPDVPVEDRIPEELVRDDIVETELKDTSDEVENEFEEDQENEVVLESLQIYKSELQAMIDNKKLSMESIRLIEYGIKRELGTFGYSRDFISLEENVSLEDYASQVMGELNAAMEGFLSGMLLQAPLLYFKKGMDHLADAFKTTDGAINKYETRVKEAVKEFEAEKSKWKETKSSVTLSELWDFFLFPSHPKNGEVFTKALDEDVKMSKYVLTGYAKQVVQEVKKGIEAFATGDVEKIVSTVRSLKTPVDLFDKKYFTVNRDDIYFGGVRLEPAAGMSRFLKIMGDDPMLHEHTAGKHGGNALVAQAQSFNTSLVMEYQAWKRSFATNTTSPLRVFANVIAANRPVEFTQKDVADIAKAAQEYLDNARGFIKLINEFSSLSATHETNEENAKSNNPEDEQQIKLAATTLKGLIAAVRVPALREMSRSIRGARYCAYLVRRITHYAEGSEKSVATEGIGGALMSIFIPFYGVYAGYQLGEVRDKLHEAEEKLKEMKQEIKHLEEKNEDKKAKVEQAKYDKLEKQLQESKKEVSEFEAKSKK